MIVKSLYDAIRTRLMEDLKNDVDLNHFDMYVNQLDDERDGRGHDHRWPAAFFRANPIDWQPLSEGRQHGSLEFFLVVADMNVNPTAHKFKQYQRDKALSIFDLVDQVTKALHLWNPQTTEAGTITRIRTDQVDTLKNVQAVVVTFRCRVHDDISLKSYIKADPDPALVATITVEKI